MNTDRDNILYAADLAGTLLFAIEGANAAARGQLDMLGVMVLAFVTALGGGIVRDLLLGATPPASLQNWRYVALAFSGGLLVFFLRRYLQGIPATAIIVLDAAALGFFAVAGTEKALNFHMHPFIAMLLGTVTGVGGGVIRDLLLARTPTILQSDIYATAAFFGSVVMILARRAKLSPAVSAVLGGVACFLLRVVAVWQHWNLPRLK